MISERVELFNKLAGNSPANTDKKLFEQIKNQCVFLVEEVFETKLASETSDWKEVIDGVADIRFVAAYLESLLKHRGIDTEEAFNRVCDNNMDKFTRSIDLVFKWADEHKRDGKRVYISKETIDGDEWYCVRNTETDKVVKPKDFVPVYLDDLVPKGVWE